MANRRNSEGVRADWLHQDLLDLARAIEFPPTPDVTSRVRAKLVSPAQKRLITGWLRLGPLPASLRYAAIAAAVLLALAAALAITPNTRDALARFFGLKRVQIIYDDSLSATATAVAAAVDQSPPPAVTPTAFAGPAETLTGATTLEDARSRAPFPVLSPAYPQGLGEPDEVFLQQLGRPDEVQVILRYRFGAESDPLFTVYQFKATGIFTKLVSSGTRLQEVNVKDARGYWIEGAFHVLEYRAADGREVVDFRRQVVGNTLAWESEDVTYRLETSLPLEEAVRIAESLR